MRVQKVMDVMADIAGSSREQASGIEQVNRAVTAMDAMTQ
jgi:methyl-accepting chemotaxis protein